MKQKKAWKKKCALSMWLRGRGRMFISKGKAEGKGGRSEGYTVVRA